MPLSPIPAWLAALERDSDAAVADLFAGRVDRGQFSRLDDAEFLARALAEPGADPASRDRVDQGLSHWLAACQAADAALRHSIGVQAHLYRLNEALAAIVLLKLPRSAHQLRDMHFAYRRWLGQYDYGYGDGPYAGYWRALAATQVDRRFQNKWHDFVVHAEERYPSYALHIGLTGLRGLDLPSDQRLLRLLNALLRRAWRIGTEVAVAEFAKRLGAVAADMPMANDGWRGRVLRLLESLEAEERASRHSLTRLQAFQQVLIQALKPWIGDIGLSRATAQSIVIPDLPTFEERLHTAQELRASSPIAISHALGLFERHRAYAEASGDAYFFVRTLCNLGHRVLQQPGVGDRTLDDLRTLLWHAMVREPINPYLWSFWAELEQAGGREDVAETVLWEAVRRFPDNEPSRVELALLLQRRHEDERTPALLAEAEQLLREAVDANPDHAPSRGELALLLQRRHEDERTPALLAEAEQLLREVVEKQPQDRHGRSGLARLLARSGRAPEARELLAQWLAGREDPVWQWMMGSLDEGKLLPALRVKSSRSTRAVADPPLEEELPDLRANAAAARFAYARERGEAGDLAELSNNADLACFYRGWFGLEPPVVWQDGVRPPYGLAALAALADPEQWRRLERDYPANARDTLLLKRYAGVALSEEELAGLKAWLELADPARAREEEADEPEESDEAVPPTTGKSDSYDQFLLRRLRATGFLAASTTGAPATADRSGDIDRLMEKHLARGIDSDIVPIALAA